jgi:hypothetical protein
MPKSHYSAAEIQLAHQLFAKNDAVGTLKAPRVLGVLGLSSGHRSALNGSEVTYRDYLRDAHAILKR